MGQGLISLLCLAVWPPDGHLAGSSTDLPMIAAPIATRIVLAIALVPAVERRR